MKELYEQLEVVLVQLTALEDQLCDAMDLVWDKLTPEEQEELQNKYRETPK